MKLTIHTPVGILESQNKLDYTYDGIRNRISDCIGGKAAYMVINNWDGHDGMLILPESIASRSAFELEGDS